MSSNFSTHRFRPGFGLYPSIDPEFVMEHTGENFITTDLMLGFVTTESYFDFTENEIMVSTQTKILMLFYFVKLPLSYLSNLYNPSECYFSFYLSFPVFFCVVLFLFIVWFGAKWHNNKNLCSKYLRLSFERDL